MLEREVVDAARDALAARGRAEVGVVGGTFDPIHRGHVALGDAARDELGLDLVVYLPAGVPSFKRGRHLASGTDRLAMVRLAIAGHEASVASALELDRPGVTYTADTLAELHAALPAGTRVTLVMGADAYATLPMWERAGAIAAGARVAWAARAGEDGDAAQAAVAASCLVVDAVRLGARIPAASSTEIRAWLLDGEADGATCGADDVGANVSHMLDPRVVAYIREHGLYRAADEA